MALNEQEEFELLSLEREKFKTAGSGHFQTFSVPSRPRQFVGDETQAARMINPAAGTRQVPVESPAQRFLYEAGGRATDALTGIGLPPEVAAGGGYLTNLAGQVGLTFAGGNMGAKLEPAAQALGTNLMTRTLKPDRLARDSGRGAAAVQTLLEEGINVTKGGADILRDKVDDLVGVANSIIDRYPGAVVEKQKVFDALNDSLSRAMKQGTPQPDMEIINKAMANFANHPLLKNSYDIPVKLAQELKQGIWRKLKDTSFGPNVMPQAERDAQKAIGSGLRKGIEDAVPEVGPVNAKTKEFLDALKLVEARAGADGNKQLVGLGALSPSMSNFLAWMLDRYPAGKSILARYFYTHADPEMVGRVAGATVGAQSGKPPNQ